MAGHAAEKSLENSAADSSGATENFAENIERIVKSAAKTPALLKRGVSETIVSGALVGIHQDVVGFAELFKFFFGVRIVRIFVRMKLHCQPAISTLNLFGRHTATDSEDFVIIALLSSHLLRVIRDL